MSKTMVLGIDVGKDWLDGHFWPKGERIRLTNDEAGRAALEALIRARRIKLVALEASGGYERPVVQSITHAGAQPVLLQPVEVRAFARLRRRLAKNDRIDAETIAEFGATFGKSRPARAPLLDKLAERLTWYEQITDDIVRLRTRRAMFSDPELRAQLTAELRRLVAAKRAALRTVRKVAMDDAVLRERIELLQTMPGVGAFVALTLVIRLPELGTLSRHAVASLAGLAPWDNDSGRRRGIRHIFGGRDRVRCALYMGALTAIRINRPIVAFYDRLCAAGKPGKVALTAAMRKMLVMLNAMLRDQRAFAA